MTDTGPVRTALEVASALGVILGLVFVGLELRHANKLAQPEALRSLNDTAVAIQMAKYEAPASEDLWVRYSDGSLAGDGDLAPRDREILRSHWTALINLYEAAWMYRNTGILGEAESDGYMSDACHVFTSSKHSKEFWGDTRTGFTSAFVSDLESRCQTLRD